MQGMQAAAENEASPWAVIVQDDLGLVGAARAIKEPQAEFTEFHVIVVPTSAR